MNTREALDPGFVESVIEHMNTDHTEACLQIVRAFSGESSALAATLNNLDRQALYFSVVRQSPHSSEQASDRVEVKVDLPKPLRNELQIRGALVGLTKKARQILSSNDD